MRLGNWDLAYWVLGFLGLITLLCVLLARRRFRVVPCFTSLVIYEILQSAVLFIVHLYGPRGLYALIYWVGEILESAIRICVFIEVARLSAFHLKRHDSRSTRSILILSLAAAATGCMMAIVSDTHIKNPLASFAVRVSLCSVIIGSSLAIMLFVTVWFGGIRFRMYSQAIIFGMAIYFAGKLVAEGALLFNGTAGWIELQNFMRPIYIVCLIAWSIIFWSDEPKQALNDEMTKLQSISLQIEELIVDTNVQNRIG